MNLRNKHFDLLIIGGGVLGAFHALHALERGLKVCLLERNAAPRGATVRNFGQVVPSGMDRHWQQFGRESLRIYQSLQSKFDLLIRQQGTIYLASDEEELALLEELQAINADVDYPAELWTVQQCRQRFPQLRTENCRGGLFFEEELSVNPRVMIHRLLECLKSQGNIQQHFQTCVAVLEDRPGGVFARTTYGRSLTADKAIICSGAEFQILYPYLFCESDLQVVQLQMLRLKSQQATLPGNILTGSSIRRYEAFSQCPSWREIKANEPDDTFARQWGIHILFKQEMDGSIILGDSHEYAAVNDADGLSFDIRSDINDFFVEAGREIFNLNSWDVDSSWLGAYCQTSDPSGVFTRSVSQNIHIVTGIGGKGMTSSAGFSKHHLGMIYND